MSAAVETVGWRRVLAPLRPFGHGWMRIVAHFGEVQTQVILSLFYASAIGIAATIVNIGRQDLLAKRGLREPDTAWNEAEAAPAELERAKTQS